MITSLKKQLLGGFDPHYFSNVNNQSTENWLVLSKTLVPNHGQKDFIPLGANIRKIYRSLKTGDVYIVAGKQVYQFNTSGVLTILFELRTTQGTVFIVENLDQVFMFVDGSDATVWNKITGDITILGPDNDFLLTRPIAVVVVDTVAIIFDGDTTVFQASTPNNFLLYATSPPLDFCFISEADDLMAGAMIDRNLYVIGENSIERWTVIASTIFLKRDDIWLAPYGLEDRNSFANKFNMFIGLFNNKQGSIQVRGMLSESNHLTTLSTAGIVKDMLLQGAVKNSDIYEINGHRYYELAFANKSYIYDFTNQIWTTSTAPKEQVVYFNNRHYGATGTNLYEIDYYSNPLKKEWEPSPFAHAKGRWEMSTLNLHFYNSTAANDLIYMGIGHDGIKDVSRGDNQVSRQINPSKRYGVLTWSVSQYDYVLTPRITTTANIVIDDLTMETR